MKFTSFFFKKKKEKKKKKKEARSLTRKEKTVIIFHLIECFRKIVNFQGRFFFFTSKKKPYLSKIIYFPKIYSTKTKNYTVLMVNHVICPPFK